MNEVTKLYKNAEPNRNCNLYKHFTECPMKHTQCEDCENFAYPSFTAEKQLELIKWILKKLKFFSIEMDWNKYACADSWISCYYKDSLEESIANYFNTRWQDLTEEERKQIKEILE